MNGNARGGEVTGSSHGGEVTGSSHGPANAVHTGLNAAALDALAVSTTIWEFME